MTPYIFTILLSASIPSSKRNEKYLKIKNAQIQIEEAIVGLSRNVFQAGGKLIFGGHPSISPLVAMVATEYKLNKNIEDSKKNDSGEKPITIYQSKAYEKVMAKETSTLYNLGHAEIVWTSAIDGEEFDPKITQTTQCGKSLTFMRKSMIAEHFDALVCVGGMDGVEEEFKIFKEYHPNKKIFLLETTGGATRILAEDRSNLNSVKVIDRLENSKTHSGKKQDELFPEIFDIIPYSFIASLIVKDLLSSKGN